VGDDDVDGFGSGCWLQVGRFGQDEDNKDYVLIKFNIQISCVILGCGAVSALIKHKG
jgi:hypothetical protein